MDKLSCVRLTQGKYDASSNRSWCKVVLFLCFKGVLLYCELIDFKSLLR